MMAWTDDQIKNKLYLNNYIFNYAVSKATLCLKKQTTPPPQRNPSIASIDRIAILHIQIRRNTGKIKDKTDQILKI